MEEVERLADQQGIHVDEAIQVLPGLGQAPREGASEP